MLFQPLGADRPHAELGAVAAYESEHKSERLKSARIQQAKQGKHHGGIRCYGYGKDGVTVVADEAAEIAAACAAIAGGASLRSIVRDMNAREAAPADRTTGKVGGWTSQQLRQTLISPRIAALQRPQGRDRRHRGWPRSSTTRPGGPWRGDPVQPGAAHQPRCDRRGEVAGLGHLPLRVRAARAAAQRHRRMARYTYRCANPDPRRRPRHPRRACPRRSRRAGDRRSVEPARHRREAAASRRHRRRGGAARRAGAARGAQGQGRCHVRRRQDRRGADFATITKRLDERAKEIAEVLAQAGWRSPLEPLAGGNIATVWEQLSLAQKRAVLEVVADVHVLPTKPTTRGFDPGGVRIDWKVD